MRNLDARWDRSLYRANIGGALNQRCWLGGIQGWYLHLCEGLDQAVGQERALHLQGLLKALALHLVRPGLGSLSIVSNSVEQI